MATLATRVCPKCSETITSIAGVFGTHVKWCGPLREQRFWEKVAKRGPDECWLWTGATYKKKNKQMGYGRYAGNGPFTYAHRCAWIFTHGPIPEGKVVMHSCDVVLCCNPAHLSLGTDAENAADMKAKGRNRNGGAKITPEQALEIRRRYKRWGAHNQTNCRELAEEFGVSMHVIYNAAKGLTWKRLEQLD